MDKLKKAFEIIYQKLGLLSFCLLIPVLKGYYDPEIPKYMVFTIGLVLFIIADSIISAIKSSTTSTEVQKPKEVHKTKYIKKGENVLDKMDDSTEDIKYAEKFLSSVNSGANIPLAKQPDSTMVDISQDITKDISISDDEIYDHLGIKL